ncbi:PHP domain-containing protein [Selenomonas sp. TAMA-11512]|uniref:PHP domain-containing protein n=1 Tax=Selenomonas sp. TAMA-11512 TaxID=3095337 RepID=UPI00309339FC|nr:PHP domain-containing protein [Selenomonas sp. TAMA-11512]
MKDGIRHRIDLHSHSTASDGTFSPAELAAEARRQGLYAFALTDHDSVYGLEEARAAAEEQGVGFIPGMEMSVSYLEGQIHVVALGFDADHPAFQKLYKRIRQTKEEGMDQVLEAIARRGLRIRREELVPYSMFDIIDRYAIMRYLKAQGTHGSISDIWHRYIDPALVEAGVHKNVTPEEALPAIQEAGGMTSLAHFHKKIGLQGHSREAQEKAVADLVDMGLTGMEQFYPDYTIADQAFAGYLIHKYALTPTAGSDFHGANRPGVELGHGEDENFCADKDMLEAILTRIENFYIV